MTAPKITQNLEMNLINCKICILKMPKYCCIWENKDKIERYSMFVYWKTQSYYKKNSSLNDL